MVSIWFMISVSRLVALLLCYLLKMRRGTRRPVVRTMTTVRTSASAPIEPGAAISRRSIVSAGKRRLRNAK